MAKRKKKRRIENLYGVRPVDRTAARVMGMGIKKKASGAKLRAENKRLTGTEAEEEARRGLEAAKWRNENPKR